MYYYLLIKSELDLMVRIFLLIDLLQTINRKSWQSPPIIEYEYRSIPKCCFYYSIRTPQLDCSNIICMYIP